MNNLIIFDIDGTLTNTNRVDSDYFERALLESLPVKYIDNQWHNYKYSTDSGMVTEIVQSAFGRDPSLEEIAAIKERFVGYLKTAFLKDKSHCLPLSGASEIFTILTQRGWDIGIATGGWEKSALLKLKTANIPCDGVPIAHSDDHMEREQIITIAIERAKKNYHRPAYAKMIYVGDRIWDKNAARNINIDFIGIGAELGNINEKDFFHINDYTGNAFIQYLESGC
ncbi:HAD family hydrolase [Legionella spiritensis]|uniref:HAD family hydrolase n=1 Tax=Legionella spiritensis TaxID=452 RepID=UPI000F6E190C|nr:HAD hydrolase-like protein [Legionella spiritensis]VEG92462.1 Uncharacterized protein conserved in bacteria [Legionella spiritensis]